jgi:hypothetical protein
MEANLFNILIIAVINITLIEGNNRVTSNSKINNKSFSILPKEAHNEIIIFYEPFCIDSVRFFKKSLKNFYYNSQDFFDANLINTITFMPAALMKYNKHSSNWKDLNYKCMHGIRECIANRFHACAHTNLSLTKSNEYAMCYMNNVTNRRFKHSSFKISKFCAEKVKFDYDQLVNCVRENSDHNLLTVLKKRDSLPQEVKNAPWIVINNQFDRPILNSVENNMLKFMCQFFNYQSSLRVCNRQ